MNKLANEWLSFAEKNLKTEMKPKIHTLLTLHISFIFV